MFLAYYYLVFFLVARTIQHCLLLYANHQIHQCN
ncbi:hypothetical protein Vspart_01452 [Vibrio spartinae]|uniref:Uncharacterized protein n=1 Tax=Vibrio spartinae TaxID=1918945 RepID=A0ABX6QYC2_9VIBR|nr:hypothetical protein Vspart_01452 [Vibrio spartinae]